MMQLCWQLLIRLLLSCFVCKLNRFLQFDSFCRLHYCPWNSLQYFLFRFNRGFQIASVIKKYYWYTWAWFDCISILSSTHQSMQYVTPQEMKAYWSNFLHNLERVRDENHVHLCFCSFLCLVDKWWLPLWKKSHRKSINAKIIKNWFYAIFYPWE